jgi:hypothetical protein
MARLLTHKAGAWRLLEPTRDIAVTDIISWTVLVVLELARDTLRWQYGDTWCFSLLR